VLNRSSPQRIAVLASIMVLGTCRVGGQTPPLLDSIGRQKSLAPLSATDPVVREGLFSIDAVVANSAGNPISDLGSSDFALLDNGHLAKIRTLHNSMAASEAAPELIFVLTRSALAYGFLRRARNAAVL